MTNLTLLQVTEIVMPNFISRISYPPTDIDVLMLDQLTYPII